MPVTTRQLSRGRPNAPIAASKTRGDYPMAKRTAPAIVCPRCGVPAARIIGRSESLPVLYLRCSDCQRTSVVPE
jgi:hypothetical protein